MEACHHRADELYKNRYSLRVALQGDAEMVDAKNRDTCNMPYHLDGH